MDRSWPTLSIFQAHRNAILWGLMALEGCIALFALLRIPSESASANFLGYSPQRLAIASATAVGLAILAVFSLASVRQPGWWRRLAKLGAVFCASEWRTFAFYAGLFGLFLSVAALLGLAVSPASRELVVLRSLLERAGLVLVWGELVIVQLGLLVYMNANRAAGQAAFLSPLRIALLVSILTAVYLAWVKIYTTATWDIRLRRLEDYIFLPAALLLISGVVNARFQDRSWYQNASRILFIAFIGVFFYTLYRHTAQWMAWQVTPSKAYWPSLAEAFLQGRLYLQNPESLHDLTLYQGRWYVPNPPLPALVLLPFVAVLGAAKINTVLFSLTCGAINSVLVYLVLERASTLGLIPTKQKANLWLTGVFALGTTHWWLSIMGRMWFLSQVLSVMLITLAVLAVLKKASPWAVGLFLGLAVLSRPNAFALWPFLAGISLFLQQHEGREIRWSPFASWAVKSALPVCLAVFGLLVYNYLRFGSFFDFGYVTINSSDWLMEAVRTYGIFNVHFLPVNFNAMFLKLPSITIAGGSCVAYSPSREGISILAMTPAVIYAFRRFKWNWWTAGAWASVLLSVGLLLFYHNTGAWQLGYRYLMDFIIPVLFIMAIGIGSVGSWKFKALACLSVLGNAAGIVWWFNKWWC
jgi:hypothetical protein